MSAYSLENLKCLKESSPLIYGGARQYFFHIYSIKKSPHPITDGGFNQLLLTKTLIHQKDN